MAERAPPKRSRAPELSLAEARRLAIASQGFGERPSKPTARHIQSLAQRIHAFQIDSVNVLARAHYVPAFARLGPYATADLDSLAYAKRDLYEFWGHAACLLPLSLYPVMRYRMHADETLEYMKTPPGAYLASVYAEVRERGPLAASDLSDPGERNSKWWGWGRGKMGLEHLFNAGLVAIAGRRGFERLYDLAERVIPRAALDAEPLPKEEAMKTLICLGAEACGVGTATDIVGYLDTDGWRERTPAIRPEGSKWSWGRRKPIAKRLVAELVEEQRIVPVAVEGWSEQAYLHPKARVPRAMHARALVTPFDSLVWERDRIRRLFGMEYTIEIYTPSHKRVYGYYVFPFLLGDTLVARCDLKADRQRGVLMVQSAHLENGQNARVVAPALADELALMAEWLELERIEVRRKGNLAMALRSATTNAAPRIMKQAVRRSR